MQDGSTYASACARGSSHRAGGCRNSLHAIIVGHADVWPAVIAQQAYRELLFPIHHTCGGVSTQTHRRSSPAQEGLLRSAARSQDELQKQLPGCVYREELTLGIKEVPAHILIAAGWQVDQL
jgi:hypothetical protein